MPVYVYECKEGHQTERVYSMAGKKDSTRCDTCGENARSIIVPTNLIPDYQPFFCENLADEKNPDGIWIQSRRHHREQMERLGVRVKEPEGEGWS